jgi:hypothetical protein
MKPVVTSLSILAVCVLILVAIAEQARATASSEDGAKRAQPNVLVKNGKTTRGISLGQFLAIRLNETTDSEKIGFAELAALASNVYAPDGVFDQGCEPAQNSRIKLPNWSRLRGWSEPAACNAALNGLHYEVWGRHTGIIMNVAVVFRGTQAFRLAHWCANLRNAVYKLCEPRSDQYLAIAGLMDNVMSGIYDEWGPDTYIFAVGHSLGGGLAELAGRSSYVNRVVNFNASPVTADDLAKLVTDASGGANAPDKDAVRALEQATKCGGYWANNPVNAEAVRISRIYEDMDILSIPRLLAGWNARTPLGISITEYRTDLLGGSPLAQHSMKSLACALRKPDLSDSPSKK